MFSFTSVSACVDNSCDAPALLVYVVGLPIPGGGEVYGLSDRPPSRFWVWSSGLWHHMRSSTNIREAKEIFCWLNPSTTLPPCFYVYHELVTILWELSEMMMLNHYCVTYKPILTWLSLLWGITNHRLDACWLDPSYSSSMSKKGHLL